MATRGTIAVQNADNTVSVVYSHWDNYLESNGVILQKHWNTAILAAQLIDGVDIISLAETFEDTEFYTDLPSRCDTYASFKDYYNKLEAEEYNYVFFDSQWHVMCEETKWEIVPLSQLLAELEA